MNNYGIGAAARVRRLSTIILKTLNLLILQGSAVTVKVVGREMLAVHISWDNARSGDVTAGVPWKKEGTRFSPFFSLSVGIEFDVSGTK